MIKKIVTTEYKFENGWRGQIDIYEKSTDITIFDEENSLIFSEQVDRALELQQVLGELLKEVK